MTAATLFVVAALALAGCVSGSNSSVLPADSDDDVDLGDDEDTSVDLNDPSLSGTVRPSGEGLTITVTRVSDGDSLRAESAEGDLEIRLLGVNAPEQDECFGNEAKVALTELLDAPEVRLHPWPGERDEFGRQLGFLVANDLFVNLALVEMGHVVARDQSDHGFGAEFEEAERFASDAGIGLWAADACGVPSDAELRIIFVEENAPGDDRENPNGEYVDFVNDGDPVSLEGWSLRDESTRHRYDFPSIEIPAGIEFRVRTGCGSDDLDARPIELFWCDPEPPVWNNNGDTAFLLDPNGAIADKVVIRG